MVATPLRSRLWPRWNEAWLCHLDDELVVLDKPAGMPALPLGPASSDDAHSRLCAWLAKEQGGDAKPPRQVQRLDRLASGLVAYPRTKPATQTLAAQLERGLPRRYLVGLSSLGRLAQPQAGGALDRKSVV